MSEERWEGGEGGEGGGRRGRRGRREEREEEGTNDRMAAQMVEYCFMAVLVSGTL